LQQQFVTKKCTASYTLLHLEGFEKISLPSRYKLCGKKLGCFVKEKTLGQKKIRLSKNIFDALKVC
jgi:hypothetical protein